MGASVEQQKNTIFVRSLLKQQADGGHLVALFEKDDRHPGGEAFVSGPDVVEVFQTHAVAVALAGGRIEKVTEPELSSTEVKK